MDLSDPAFLLALVLSVAGLAAYLKLRPREPEPLRCPDCQKPMELDEEIIDPDNPELRYVPGERRGVFLCPECHKRVRARY